MVDLRGDVTVKAVARVKFLFAPGAGAPSTSPWMQAWAARLASMGDVTTLDYPYMRGGRRRPDRQPTLVDAHREALAKLRATVEEEVPAEAGEVPVFLIGKSMGSRMGCHLAVELQDGVGDVDVDAEGTGSSSSRPPALAGLICLGYPLVSGASGAMRDQVLLALRTPIFFVQGTRDPLCPLGALEPVLARMTAPHRLHIVEGGNHSLELPAARRDPATRDQAQADSDAAVCAAIAAFVTDVTTGGTI
ncbi:MAG: alpha/beta family hydrolase [Pseudomonadota bacterium]